MAMMVVKPEDIEKRSMEIIVSELDGRTWPEPTFSVVRRCIHTSADFDYADNLLFSKDAAEIGVRLLSEGADIVTDTKMAASGINGKRLAENGGSVHCFISDEDVAIEAKERGCTRATVSMERGASIAKERSVIFAIGNAPTALVRICELIEQDGLRPALVIGAPVGFVNVVEAKEMLRDTLDRYGIPYIIPMGRKGGSNIAATICNAMMYYRPQ